MCPGLTPPSHPPSSGAQFEWGLMDGGKSGPTVLVHPQWDPHGTSQALQGVMVLKAPS